MNWQDDPELQRKMQQQQVRGRLLRSTLLWGPPFLASLAALVFFTADRLFIHDYGSTWFLVVVLTVFTVLFGFQAIQSFMDDKGDTVSEQGRVTRRWARSDSFVIKTHYIRLEQKILRGDQLILDGIREGDWVEATYYPHSAVLVSVEKRDAPAEEGAREAIKNDKKL
jgi:hypothetical protein